MRNFKRSNGTVRAPKTAVASSRAVKKAAYRWPTNLSVSSRTDRGRLRERNEDRVLVDRTAAIFLLADGMGGHRAGEMASALAVNEAYAFLRDRIEEKPSDQRIGELLIEAARASHHAVLSRAHSLNTVGNMGTTLISLVIRGTKAFIGHTGDSRAYLMRDRLVRMTEDHAYRDPFMDFLLRTDDTTAAATSKLLTRAVGIDAFQPPDVVSLDRRENDLLLLCSDGLTDMLSDDQIEGWVRTYRSDTEGLAKVLVREANRNGGYDNISVVVIR